MPPSAIHMDHVRTTTQQLHHTAALDKSSGTENAKAEAGDKTDKGEGMSFWDVLDVVNPLQHIPGVNKIYQAISGDTIRTPAKVAGAALFFGPIGMAVASADAILQKETGKDAIDHVASTLGLEQDSPAPPATDDPFTVTAPRPVRTADAADAPAPAAAAPVMAGQGQPVDLSAGQAALLESLMGGGQTLPGAAPVAAIPAAPKPVAAAPTMAAPSMAATATSISARTPAAGGIANAQQLKDLETTPGASAALTAARGMGQAAIVASLPAPGAAGAGDNLLAAMEQDQQRMKSPNGGKGLAEYRAAAISSGSMGVKPVVASRANQMVRAAGANMPDAAVPTRAATAPRAVPPQATIAAPSSVNAAPVVPAPATTIPATSPTQQEPAAWPPGGATPLPKELIADMMTRAMDKYQAQSRTGASNGSTIH